GLRKQEASYGLRRKYLDWEVRRVCRPISQYTPSNPSPWICCILCTSLICAEMCRRSVMLELHTSLYVAWNTLQ
ncbi:hypothetical protein TNCV_1940261, partial [Trichonephila clavipes]